MRNEQHYRKMFDRNPNASIGFTLAAAAVYAARYGVCEPEQHSTEEWRQIARDLKNSYGETLTRDEVLFEMDGAIIPDDLITQAEAAQMLPELTKGKNKSLVQTIRQAIDTGRLTAYDNPETEYQRQGKTLVSRADIERLWG